MAEPTDAAKLEAMSRLVAILVGREPDAAVLLTEDETKLFREGRGADRLHVEVLPEAGSPSRLRVVVSVID